MSGLIHTHKKFFGKAPCSGCGALVTLNGMGYASHLRGKAHREGAGQRREAESTAEAIDPEQDWSNPMAQTKTQLLRDLAGLMEESRTSTAAMDRARIVIDSLRGENNQLRELLARFCDQVPHGCMHVPTYLIEASQEAIRKAEGRQ